MRNTLLIALISFLCLSAIYAQTALPYYSGFDNTSEQNGWTQMRKGEIDPNYEWAYESFAPYSAPNLLIHYYPVGGMDVVDDWFISPAFDFTLGGHIDSVRFAFAGFGTPMVGDTVAIYLINGSDDPDLATTKTMLVEFVDTNYVADDTWRRMDSIEIPAMPGETHIAFRYVTINNWLDVKFDNIALSANQPTGIGTKEQFSQDITLFPNPSDGLVKLQFSEDLQQVEKLILNVYNSVGELVARKTLSANQHTNLEEAGGMYFYKVENGAGTILKSGKLVIH